LIVTPLRRHRLLTILVSLASILFMQFALAGYACNDRDAKVQEAAQMAHAGMACAGSMPMAMDEDQPALCHAHCEAGQQAVDTQTFHLPDAALSGHVDYGTPALTFLCERPALQAPLLARATSPPLAIQHCCFRI
jgi:hypothetical protein